MYGTIFFDGGGGWMNNHFSVIREFYISIYVDHHMMNHGFTMFTAKVVSTYIMLKNWNFDRTYT